MQVIRLAYIVLTLALMILLVLAGVFLLTIRSDDAPTPVLLSCIVVVASLVLAGRELATYLRNQQRTLSTTIRAVSISVGVCVLVGLGRVPVEAGVVLSMLFLMYVAATMSDLPVVIVLPASGISLAALFASSGQTLAAVIMLALDGLTIVARLLAARIIREWQQTSRLFSQARWAAAELSSVVMRVEESVHRARIYEMTRERRRVAREIHDTIGYTLTGLIVQIELLGSLVTNREAKHRLENLEGIARQALQDVRREVSHLREDIDDDMVVPWRRRWIQVCEYFAECTGVRVDHGINENLEQVPKVIGETCYRIIQEGLTNAYRHGKATSIDVSMTWKQDIDMILFRISDNGAGVDKLIAGNGLAGIRERVEVIGGTLAYDSLPTKGFDLGIDLPWKGAGALVEQTLTQLTEDHGAYPRLGG